MAVYKPYKKTASGKEEVKIPYSSIAGTPTIPTVNNGTLTIQKNGTKVQTFTANQSSSVTANITVPTKASDVNALSLDGGTINKSKTIKMDASANSDGANLKWGTVNSKNPYIGYASDQVDGTFVVGSLLGTNYASGLAIGGGSGNLLWKGTKVATTSDIPNVPTFHLYEHNIYLYAHKTSGVYFDVYFKVIMNSATPITYAMLGTTYKDISISATGHGRISDPEGTTKQFHAIVIRIYHNGAYLLVDSVYDNLTVTPIISNESAGTYLSSSEVTITDHVGTIL